MQKTAGSYLGKYLSMTFATILNETSESLDDDAARAVRWAAKQDATFACEAVEKDYFDTGDFDKFNDADRSRSVVSQVMTSPRVRVDYLGTYRYDDLPVGWARNATTMEIVDKKVNDRMIPCG